MYLPASSFTSPPYGIRLLRPNLDGLRTRRANSADAGGRERLRSGRFSRMTGNTDVEWGTGGQGLQRGEWSLSGGSAEWVVGNWGFAATADSSATGR